MADPRKVPAATIRRVAVHGLARMACMYGDPKRDDHDHDLCVRDDEAYAADALLSLVTAITDSDDDHVLDWLTAILATVQHPE